MRRIALAFALAACASPAFAVQDRYGPPTTVSPAIERIAPLAAGSLLDWSGKAAAPQAMPEAVAAPAGPPRPTPFAPQAQRLAPPQPQAVVAPQQQARLLPPPVDSRPSYAMRAGVAPPPIPTALAPNATERPRVYSVARQYGEQPDPIRFVAAPRGQPMILADVPAGANLAQSQASLDEARADRADISETRQNAASNRIPRFVP